MTEEPDDDSIITEQDYIDARKRAETMPTFIPDIFARAVTGNGVQGDVLIGYDKLPDSTPK